MNDLVKAFGVFITAVTVIVIVSTWYGMLTDFRPHQWKAQTLTYDSEAAEGEPMVFSLSYWEQTANALSNLFDLQCWASTMNISKVVEPAIFSLPGSVFHFTGRPNITFRDYFDLSFWNSMNGERNNSILVSQEIFWRKACKNLFFIQLQFGRKNSSCSSLEKLSKTKWYRDLASNGFHIRNACIHTTAIHDKDFQEKVFAFIGSQTSSILFNEWRGINEQKSFRLQLKDSRCQNSFSDLTSPHLMFTKPRKIKYPHSSRSPIAYSKNLLSYRDVFLSEYMHGSKFVAVMVRTEKLNYSIISSNLSESFCVKAILSDHEKALTLADANRTLFFTDFGVHGSSSWARRISKQSASSNFSQYLEISLNPFYSSTELNDQLELITKSNDSILIALLQSAVAASADAIVLVGGASFQVQTLNIYAHNHRGHEKYFLRDSQCACQYINYFNH